MDAKPKQSRLPPEFELIGVTVPDLPGNKQIESVCAEFNGRIIDFYTMNMDNLTVIAKNRILPVPTLLLFHGQKTVARIVKDIPSLTRLRQIISKLTKE